jgi:hypothetical protein
MKFRDFFDLLDGHFDDECDVVFKIKLDDGTYATYDIDIVSPGLDWERGKVVLESNYNPRKDSK